MKNQVPREVEICSTSLQSNLTMRSNISCNSRSRHSLSGRNSFVMAHTLGEQLSSWHYEAKSANVDVPSAFDPPKAIGVPSRTQSGGSSRQTDQKRCPRRQISKSRNSKHSSASKPNHTDQTLVPQINESDQVRKNKNYKAEWDTNASRNFQESTHKKLKDDSVTSMYNRNRKSILKDCYSNNQEELVTNSANNLSGSQQGISKNTTTESHIPPGIVNPHFTEAQQGSNNTMIWDTQQYSRSLGHTVNNNECEASNEVHASPASALFTRDTDRPPSRQRHAFPTHLIEDMKEQNTNDNLNASDTSPTILLSERPRSRYKIKARHHHKKQPKHDSAGREGPALRSNRRFLRDDINSHDLCDQSYHDPLKDGFGYVDESIPPPFRVKITTTGFSADFPVEARSLGQRPKHSRDNQLKQTNEFKRDKEKTVTPQWFSPDAQINNAHLFETVKFPSSNVNVNRFEISHSSTDRLSAAQSQDMAVTKPILYSQYSEQIHWFGQGKTSFLDFDNMDPETAIAKTPLFPTDLQSSELLSPTHQELSDLQLDDYVNMEHISMPSRPSKSASTSRANAQSKIHRMDGGINTNGNSGAGSTTPLITSLGRDFLSLFAQH